MSNDELNELLLPCGVSLVPPAKFVGTAKVQTEPVNLSKLEIEHAALQAERDQWKALVVIGCEEDEDVKRMARPFLTDLEIDGDKYGVPGTVGIVEALCNKLKTTGDNLIQIADCLIQFEKDLLGEDISPEAKASTDELKKLCIALKEAYAKHNRPLPS